MDVYRRYLFCVVVELQLQLLFMLENGVNTGKNGFLLGLQELVNFYVGEQKSL